jgi:hypothetical protein
MRGRSVLTEIDTFAAIGRQMQHYNFDRLSDFSLACSLAVRLESGPKTSERQDHRAMGSTLPHNVDPRSRACDRSVGQRFFLETAHVSDQRFVRNAVPASDPDTMRLGHHRINMRSRMAQPVDRHPADSQATPRRTSRRPHEWPLTKPSSIRPRRRPRGLIAVLSIERTNQANDRRNESSFDRIADCLVRSAESGSRLGCSFTMLLLRDSSIR